MTTTLIILSYMLLGLVSVKIYFYFSKYILDLYEKKILIAGYIAFWPMMLVASLVLILAKGINITLTYIAENI